MKDDERDVVGSLAEEAAKLFGALSTNLSPHAVGEHLDAGSPECDWCPVCRTVRVVRELSPEVRSHLTVAASSLAQAAAGLLATVASESPAETGGVENIAVTEEWPDA